MALVSQRQIGRRAGRIVSGLVAGVMLCSSMQVLAAADYLQSLIKNTPNYLPRDSGGPVDGTNDCGGARTPTINDPAGVADAINKFVIDNGGSSSPFDGLGDAIVSGATDAGVNPFLVIAIARKESAFGTAGIATQGTYNAFGRTAVNNQPHVTINGRDWYKWADWEDSVNGPNDNQSDFLKRVYIDDFGLTNIRDIIFRYAPPSENNTELYAQQIDQWISELATDSGTAVSCENSTATAGSDSGNAALGKQIAAADYGWSGPEAECLDKLWTNESGWQTTADNPSSTAYGIPQALLSAHHTNIDKNYPGYYEGDWRKPTGGQAEPQIRWGLDYIKGKYGTPCKAWSVWQSNSPHSY
jgi:hypothetical protein